MITRDSVLSGTIITLLGGLLTAVPIFDMWEDIYVQGEPPVTTFIENLPLLALGFIIIVAGIWLAWSDWEDKYARRIALYTIGNTVFVALLIGIVIGVQLELQGRLKPFIIAADAVLIAAVGGIVIGVRSAQQEMALTEAETQRNRAEAMFDNFTDAVALVAVNDGNIDVLRVNNNFEDKFGFEPKNLEEIRDKIVPEEYLAESKKIGQRITDGEPVRREITRKTSGGEGEFILQTVPVGKTPTGGNEMYIVYIDISKQKEREHQLEFLSSLLRHDIQNGLTVIRSRAEHLTETLDGRAGKFARTIENRSDDLSVMTDRFRVMLDALTGDVTEELSSFTLANVIENQCEKLTEAHPNIDVTIDIPAGLQVLGDELLENVVWNLLSNAVEHNDSDEPSITVTARESGEEIRIEFADDGPGVPDELKDAIFRRHASKVDNDVGSGFGLFFVDKMIQRYGGEIHVEDNDPTGAIFVVRLPKP